MLSSLRFDVVLNCTDSLPPSGLDVMKEWRNAKFVTLTTPLLRNINAFGLPLGVISSFIELSYDNLKVQIFL